MAKPQEFQGTVTAVGDRAVIALPFDPEEVWGRRGRHLLAGTIGGCRWHGVPEPHGEGFAVAMGPVWRRDNGVELGATVEVVLAPEDPQLDNVGPDIAAGLAAEPEARAFFEGLAGFYRRNFIRWIEGAKRPATRAARIAGMMALLRERKREK